MVSLLKGGGRFDVRVVATSLAQDVLALLAGPKVPGGYDLDCLAALLCHDENTDDPNAVGVFIVHASGKVSVVGYLPRTEAKCYRKGLIGVGGQNPKGMLCRAKIVGGWNDGAGDIGLYGVRLDLRFPLALRTAAAWKNWSKRLL